jgi:hypothetical protein
MAVDSETLALISCPKARMINPELVSELSLFADPLF